MAQGAKQFDQGRMAAELKKRLQRDRSKLERAYSAMEESGESDAFLDSLLNSAEEAAQDAFANDDQANNRKRITPNQPRNPRTKRKPKRATRRQAAPEKQYSPFNLDPKENPPLVEDNSLSSGIYPAANDDAQETDEDDQIIPPAQVDQEQQYAATLAKNRQAKKPQSGATVSVPKLAPPRSNAEAKQQLRKLRPYISKIKQRLKKVNQKLRPLVRKKRLLKLTLHTMRAFWGLLWAIGGLLALFGVGEILMVMAKALGSYIKNIKRIIKRLEKVIDPLKKQQQTLKKQLVDLTKVIVGIQRRQQLQRRQQPQRARAS